MRNTLFTILFALSSFAAFAQNYSIDWFTVDGGGGTSTGGTFSVTGIIGQPDAGTLTGGNFKIDGGFWGILGAIQTPGAPLLSVARSNNAVVISWPDTAANFRLEHNNAIENTNGWANVGQPFSTNAGKISLTIPSPAGNNFYRLKNP